MTFLRKIVCFSEKIGAKQVNMVLYELHPNKNVTKTSKKY